MSAAADSTAVTSGPAVSNDTSRLEQPTDALPMETLPQPQSSANDAKETAATAETTTATSQPSAAAAVATEPSAAPTSDSKGKGIESAAPPPPLKERQDSIMAIGPAQDEIKAVSPGDDSNPVCNIILFLLSGSRHPYKIDERYLERRNVPIPEETESGQSDPFSISVYTLKELILREWRNDWEAKPASPSSIRLIYLGKLLDDKEPLKKYSLSREAPNVVHMSIRPQDLDEEEPKSGSKALGSGRGSGDREGSGRCCVIL